ncbi:MAG TPA: hypothetical protein VM328_04105 [Fimbriimonadaceae bacterium]|nr:hypothetical protein [Fimbriimonadaceae bacterium]
MKMMLALVVLLALQRPLGGHLQVGDAAPDFTLKSVDGKSSFTLSSNFGKRPTLLIFGSYT